MSKRINHKRRYFLTTMLTTLTTIAATQLGRLDYTKQHAMSATAELPIEGELPSLVDATTWLRAWDVLMQRLGYPHYVSQGGDWGAIISDALARQAPPGLLGIHVKRLERAATIPPDVAKALTNGEPAPANLTAEEQVVFNQIRDFNKTGAGYAAIMGTRPQTIGYSLADSPVGLATWIYDKFAEWEFTRGEPERSLTRDEILDDITLYWLTNTGTSGARLYWENNANNVGAFEISIPAAVTIFPGEIYQPSRRWTERAYPNLIYYYRVEKGGHFAAWEEPQLFSEEIRAAFRSLR